MSELSVTNNQEIELSILQLPKRALSESQGIVEKIEDDFAPIYDEFEWAKPPLQIMREQDEEMLQAAFAPLRDADGRFSDRTFCVAGVGTGREVLYLAASGANIIGIDLANNYLTITKSKLSQLGLFDSTKIVLQKAPYEDVSFKSSSLDGVTSLFGVLNHVDDWQRAIQNTFSALKPGGIFVASMYGPNCARVFQLQTEEKLSYRPALVQKRALGGLRLGDEEAILPARFPAPDDIETELSNAGFEVLEMRGFLNITALYPDDPTEENIQKFKDAVESLEPELGLELRGLDKKEDILGRVRAFDEGITLNRSRLSEFAYVGFVAKKPKN